MHSLCLCEGVSWEHECGSWGGIVQPLTDQCCSSRGKKIAFVNWNWSEQNRNWAQGTKLSLFVSLDTLDSSVIIMATRRQWDSPCCSLHLISPIHLCRFHQPRWSSNLLFCSSSKRETAEQATTMSEKEKRWRGGWGGEVARGWY